VRPFEMTYDELEAAFRVGKEVYVVCKDSERPLKLVPSASHKIYFYDNTRGWAFYDTKNRWHAYADCLLRKQQL
jgi:hypothetical protein